MRPSAARSSSHECVPGNKDTQSRKRVRRTRKKEKEKEKLKKERAKEGKMDDKKVERGKGGN